ncbi:MAG: hypothetical protein DME26_06890 [Verrucomicrobia bacterium]|nr:MAG: hypothetical protein DME26_06890 [Verrucomicrobiota bacterium]
MVPLRYANPVGDASDSQGHSDRAYAATATRSGESLEKSWEVGNRQVMRRERHVPNRWRWLGNIDG